MRAASKAKAERMLLTGPMDDVFMLDSKNSVAASGISGSFARSHYLPDFFVLLCASFALMTCGSGPMSMLINPETNRPFTARFSMSNTGSVNNNITVACMQRFVLDVVPNVSLENSMVGICDVFGDHISVAVINFFQKHGIALILRPPHTSHALQTEDLVNFLVFKPAFLKAK